MYLHAGSNSRVCALNDESVGDLELPVFRDTGDIVNVSTYNITYDVLFHITEYASISDRRGG